MWKALQAAGEPVGRGHVERQVRFQGIQRRGRPWKINIPDSLAHYGPAGKLTTACRDTAGKIR